MTDGGKDLSELVAAALATERAQTELYRTAHANADDAVAEAHLALATERAAREEVERQRDAWKAKYDRGSEMFNVTMSMLMQPDAEDEDKSDAAGRLRLAEIIRNDFGQRWKETEAKLAEALVAKERAESRFKAAIKQSCLFEESLEESQAEVARLTAALAGAREALLDDRARPHRRAGQSGGLQ